MKLLSSSTSSLISTLMVLTAGPKLGASLSTDGENICGWTIEEDKQMTADSVCPCKPDEPAVTVTNGATLDLNGFKIRCLGGVAEACISLRGKGAIVKNGGVNNCSKGIYVGGGGEHTVTGMSITNAEIGILLRDDSDDVVVSDNVVDSPKGYGIVVEGDRATVSNNEVVSATLDGIYIEVEADDTVVRDNTVSNSGGNGIYVDGDTTLVESNFITNSEGNGIEVDNGADEPELASNNIIASRGSGIYVNEDNAVIEKNEITGNDQQQDGIVVEGNEVSILENIVTKFQNDGLVLTGSNGVIEGNSITSLVKFADGIVVGARGESVSNLVADNTVIADDGIVMGFLAEDNTITGNHITGDSRDGACGNNNWEDDNTYVNGEHGVACA